MCIFRVIFVLFGIFDLFQNINWKMNITIGTVLVKKSLLGFKEGFSLLSTLSSQQDSASKNYIEASVMCRYNDCQRRAWSFPLVPVVAFIGIGSQQMAAWMHLLSRAHLLKPGFHMIWKSLRRLRSRSKTICIGRSQTVADTTDTCFHLYNVSTIADTQPSNF